MSDHLTIVTVIAVVGLWALRLRKSRQAPAPDGRLRTDIDASSVGPRQAGAIPRARPRPPGVRGAVQPGTRAPSAASSAYLLGLRSPEGASDQTRAMMDAMAGPGVCTPPRP